jgi:hypothetical protein
MKACAREKPPIIAVFEERPKGYVTRASTFGLDLETPQETGKLGDPLPAAARPLCG